MVYFVYMETIEIVALLTAPLGNQCRPPSQGPLRRLLYSEYQINAKAGRRGFSKVKRAKVRWLRIGSGSSNLK